MMHLTLDTYTLLAPINTGFFGTVYRARDAYGRLVAIKMTKDFPLDEEAAILDALHTNGQVPGVPRLHETLPRGAKRPLCLVLDYMPGDPLILLEANSLPLSSIVRAITRLLTIMVHLHAAHVVQQDLNTGNILFERAQERLSLVDFGLGRLHPPEATYHFEAIAVLEFARMVLLLYGDETTACVRPTLSTWFDEWVAYTHTRMAFLRVSDLLDEWHALVPTLSGVDAQWLSSDRWEGGTHA
jgi:serine/threonine protein kinase